MFKNQSQRIFLRFVTYHAPYTGSILLAMGCALCIAICDLSAIQIFEDTINAFERIFGNSFAEPVSIRYFQIKEPFHFPGFEISLTDSGTALRALFWLLGGLLLLVLIKGLFVYGNDYLMARVGHKVTLRLRDALYQCIIFAPLGILRKERSGDLMARMTDDVRMWQTAVAAMANIIRAITLVIVFMTVMLIKSYQMTLFALIILPFLAYLITKIGTRIRKASTEIQLWSADIYAQLKETLFGIKIIKSFTAEQAEIERFGMMNWHQYCAAMRRARLAAFLPPTIEFLGAIGIAAVFGLGCWQIINGQLSTGGFIGYITMVSLMLKPIKTIGSVNNVLQQSLASAERIFYVLNFLRENSSEKVERHTSLSTTGRSSHSHIKLDGAVKFQNVSFAYHQEPVIKKVSFEASPGDVVALVGPSGSGKTTLLNLLLRFYDVDAGTIWIDNTCISKVTLSTLRQNIALVPQDTFLFDGTILENIGYGAPGAPRELIISAAKQANAHEFIKRKPQRYDTLIGEAGITLSGGEQQRISIARAILKDAPILVLDEATSALDTQSEALIQKSLTNLMENRTSFIIAHRLSTVVRADKILVVQTGEIVETGTHQTLLAKGGTYHKLCKMQFGID